MRLVTLHANKRALQIKQTASGYFGQNYSKAKVQRHSNKTPDVCHRNTNLKFVGSPSNHGFKHPSKVDAVVETTSSIHSQFPGHLCISATLMRRIWTALLLNTAAQSDIKYSMPNSPVIGTLYKTYTTTHCYMHSNTTLYALFCHASAVHRIHFSILQSVCVHGKKQVPLTIVSKTHVPTTYTVQDQFAATVITWHPDQRFITVLCRCKP